MTKPSDDRIVAGLKYATTFDEKLFGQGCDVEIVADIGNGSVDATVAMRQFLRSGPAFRIAERDLAAFADAIRDARRSVALLDEMVEGATDHQINFSIGGASLIVVRPEGRQARFVISIGMFSQEGEIDKLSCDQLDVALRRIAELKTMVGAKIADK